MSNIREALRLLTENSGMELTDDAKAAAKLLESIAAHTCVFHAAPLTPGDTRCPQFAVCAICGQPPRVLASQPAAAVSDGWKEAAIAWEVCASVHRQWAKGKDALFTTRQADYVKHADDARAIPALSPAQQAPEWVGGEPANLQAAARDADEWLALIQRLNDAGRWRFSRPDSRPKLDGCRAALSKILCAPAQQAVPMTCTWAEDDETGNYATTCGHVFALNDGGPTDNGMKFCCYCGGGITAQGAQEGV